jgi:hypothetical protein
LGITVTRIWTRTIVEEANANAQAAGLYYKSSTTTFYSTSYYLTQAAIDAGLLPAIPTDNPTGYPFGFNSYQFGDVDATSEVKVQEYRDTQECCNPISVTRTVSGPDDYYYDNQGTTSGPFSTSTSRITTDTPYYTPGFGYCYDCCCQRIPTACAQVTTC